MNFKGLIRWLDDNLLAVLAGFLLVFIPLYPKWPLFDILYGYNVRVRLEDFWVLFALLVLFVQLVRRKVIFKITPVIFFLMAYLIVGFLSVLTSIFVIKTVPVEYLHMAKTFFHWLRRVEYFSLFFVFFGSIKNFRRVKIYTLLFFITFLGVIIYGYGQKYFYWPAFSTMNREFAKGWWLYLTEHARVLSTFGGHYDLAGYLVIALTLAWSFFFGLKNRLAKIAFGFLIAGGFWLLILTASRISFAGYLAGLAVVIFLWAFRKGLGWGMSRFIISVGLSILIMLSFGDLSDRFLRLLKLEDRVSGLKAVLLRPSAPPPEQKAIFLENNLAAVASKSDVPPSPNKPREVTGEEIPLLIPTKTASGSTILVEKTRTYSKNALLYDLSTGIRLDATWPRAIAGFKADPVLGSGYATLTKETKEEFTEGESTDSEYLRSLGETGLLGFLTFFGTIGLMAAIAFKSLGGIKDNYLYALISGFIGLIVGLLINATTIDIFTASKVAYVFWGVSGVCMGSLYLFRDKIKTDFEPLRVEFSLKFLFSDFFWVILILILTFSLRTYKLDTILGDWHSWRQADTSAVTRNFINSNNINWLYPTFDDLSSIPSGKPNPRGLRYVEFPLYNAASVVVKKIVPELKVEEAGRVTTDLASTLSVLFIFLICRKIISRRVAYLAALTFSTLPYSIYYGRTILPDPTMVMLSLGALWFGINKKIFLSLVFAAAALLVKPYAIFLLAPLVYFDRKYLFYYFIASLPLLWWRWWMQQFPEGIPASTWLLNGDGIRFKGAFWYWLFADRIGRLILGYWGLIPLAFGWIKASRFVKIFFVSCILYLIIFATGNVRHDYYQILLLPAISILVGLGLDYLLSLNKLLAIISFLFMLGFGWYHVRDFYNINHPEIAAAGRRVEELSFWKSRVIAPYDGDTAFLYQTARKGWPIVEKPIPEMIKMGADYYVSVRFDDLTNNLIKESQGLHPKYKLLVQTDQYVIIQLVPDNKLPKE